MTITETDRAVLDEICYRNHRPGVTYSIDTPNLEIYISWHEPSTNLNWYPILQIDDRSAHKTIFFSEGPENEDAWGKWLYDSTRTILKKLHANE